MQAGFIEMRQNIINALVLDAPIGRIEEK